MTQLNEGCLIVMELVEGNTHPHMFFFSSFVVDSIFNNSKSGMKHISQQNFDLS